MSSVVTAVRGQSEKLKLVGFFIVMLVVSANLFRTLGQAWQSSVIAQPLIDSLRPLLSINREQFAMFWLGVFLGLLLLITIDPKKRLQAILLWVGTIAAVVALDQLGLLLPNLEPTRSYGWAVAGVVAGSIGGGGRRLTNINTPQPLEFRRAGQIMFYILSLVVVIGLLEYHVQVERFLRVTQAGLVIQSVTPQPEFRTQSIFTNLALSGTFLYTLNRFIEYDAQADLFILGPTQSGKSLFLVGMYKEAQRRLERKDEAPAEPPSAGLQQLVQAFSAQEQDTGWGLDSTQEINSELRFGFIAGSLFPKNITLSSTDYAGEDLERLSESLLSDDEPGDQTIRELRRRVDAADTLVYIIDCNRLVEGEPLGVAPYFDIIRANPNKEAMIVATKADLLAEEFNDETGLEPQLAYEEFVDYVNDRLRTNENALGLLQTTNATAQPVYYQTREEDGSREPMRDRDGSANPVGFDKLMNRLG
jgi:hypothetical protein